MSVRYWWKLRSAHALWLELCNRRDEYTARIYFGQDGFKDLKDQFGLLWWKAASAQEAQAKAKKMAVQEVMAMYYRDATL